MADVVYEGAKSDGLDQKDAEGGDERDEQHDVGGWDGLEVKGTGRVEEDAGLFDSLHPFAALFLAAAFLSRPLHTNNLL